MVGFIVELIWIVKGHFLFLTSADKHLIDTISLLTNFHVIFIAQFQFQSSRTEYSLNPDYFYPPPPPPTWDSSNEALPDNLGG